MTTRWNLSPLGTASGLLRHAGPAPGSTLAPPPRLPSFPTDLVEALSRHEGGEELLFLAWELARCAEGLDGPEQRALLLLALASLVRLREGSTRLPLGDRLEEVLTPLGATAEDVEVARRLVARTAEGADSPARAVLGIGDEYRPLIVDGAWLSTHRMRRLERRLVRHLRARLAAPSQPIESAELKRAFEDVVSRAPAQRGRPVQLSDEQKSAVLAALHGSLTVVTGGPGTGKTSIVVSLLRMLVRLGTPPESIALAAPTGKAANRMLESIRRYLDGLDLPSADDERLREVCPEPQTLHRLLGYSPSSDRFRHHENNVLAADVVIVDECSMIDLFMMDQLVRAVRPDARLVLLGDAEQLPSVEAGAVLRDLVPRELLRLRRPWDSLVAESLPLQPVDDADDPRVGSVVRLTHSYRMDGSDPAGKRVLSVAQAMNRNDAAALWRSGDAAVDVRESPRALAFEGVELLDTAPDQPAFRDFLTHWYERLYGQPDVERLVRRGYSFDAGEFGERDEADLRTLFAAFERQRLLCVTRSHSSPTGAAAVNRYLHERHVERVRAGSAPVDDAAIFPGEPVMVERNDYERGLFNGDQGLVLRVSSSGRAQFMAVFPRAERYVAFPLDLLRSQLSLSFAMTVHKSQGSEFDGVGLVLPEEDIPLLTREILYTAVTRARRSVVVAGRRDLLDVGIARIVRRDTGLEQALSGTDSRDTEALEAAS